MYAFLKTWISLKSDRRGVTALEYGLIAALVAGVIIGGAINLGNSVKGTFNNVANWMNMANNGVAH